MHKTLRLLFIAIAALSANSTFAADLLDFYRSAKYNDPKLHAAYHQNQADLQSLPQAVSAFLPTLNGSGYTKGTNSTDPAVGKSNTWAYQLTVSQPIFRYVDWSNLVQAQNKVKSAMATLEDAEQSLLLRVATQYFSILKAQDDLSFARSERKAFSRHLEQVQQRFKVGIIAITDVYEATARRDNAYSQEITAENLLANEKEKLREIVGEPVFEVSNLSTKIKLPKPNPTNIEAWVRASLEQNWQLQATRYNLASSKELINREHAGHLPTITVDANLIHSKALPPTHIVSTNKDISLNLSMPLFSGGSVFYKTKAARETYEQARATLEEQSRTIESSARQSYRNVFNKIGQVSALKQTVTSTKIALNATKSAFDVGTRTIVDVLNAQSDVLNAERNYYKAHYEYIVESLRLKKNAGILSINDLAAINRWLHAGNHNTDYIGKDIATSSKPETTSTVTTTSTTKASASTDVTPATTTAPTMVTKTVTPAKNSETSIEQTTTTAVSKNKPQESLTVTDTTTSKSNTVTKEIESYSAAKPSFIKQPITGQPAVSKPETVPLSKSEPAQSVITTTTTTTAPAKTVNKIEPSIKTEIEAYGAVKAKSVKSNAKPDTIVVPIELIEPTMVTPNTTEHSAPVKAAPPAENVTKPTVYVPEE